MHSEILIIAIVPEIRRIFGLLLVQSIGRHHRLDTNWRERLNHIHCIRFMHLFYLCLGLRHFTFFHQFEPIKFLFVNFNLAGLLFLPLWWRILGTHHKRQIFSGSTKLFPAYIAGSFRFELRIVVFFGGIDILPIRLNSHPNNAATSIWQVTSGLIPPSALFLYALNDDFRINLFIKSEQSLGIHLLIRSENARVIIVATLLVIVVVLLGLLL